MLLVLILGLLLSKADAQGSAPSGVGSESPFSVWLDPSETLQFSLRQLSSDLSSASSSAVRRFVPFLGPAQKTAYGQGTSSGQGTSTGQKKASPRKIKGISPEKEDQILALLVAMYGEDGKRLLESYLKAGNQIVVENIYDLWAYFGLSDIDWDRDTASYTIQLDIELMEDPVLAAQLLMERLVEMLGEDRRGMTGALLELDPTYDETTLKLWQQSQEAAVKAGASIAADLSEMYFSGLMELTVVGTVQLVIFYGGEGEYGKAVLAAAPLTPGVLRKGKELLPKKGTNLADDAVKGVAPGKVVHGHHPLPKFLGGNSKQVLSKLDPKIHTEFHRLLRENLRKKGIPLNVGGRGGSALDWAEYMNRFPGTQRKAFDAVLEASRSIDVKYGTNIVQDVWTNIMDGSFRSFP